jgi:hypothetical protein
MFFNFISDYAICVCAKVGGHIFFLRWNQLSIALSNEFDVTYLLCLYEMCILCIIRQDTELLFVDVIDAITELLTIKPNRSFQVTPLNRRMLIFVSSGRWSQRLLHSV